MHAILFALVPFLWTGLLVATWHFAIYDALLPISLPTLLFPACFGYAGFLLIESPDKNWHTPSMTTVLATLSIFNTFIGYACSLYGTGSVLGIIPEIYKFGGTVVSLRKTTVELWLGLTVASIAIAARILFLSTRKSVIHRLCRATLGMAAGTAIIFIPFLASSYVAFR